MRFLELFCFPSDFALIHRKVVQAIVIVTVQNKSKLSALRAR